LLIPFNYVIEKSVIIRSHVLPPLRTTCPTWKLFTSTDTQRG